MHFTATAISCPSALHVVHLWVPEAILASLAQIHIHWFMSDYQGDSENSLSFIILYEAGFVLYEILVNGATHRESSWKL